MNFYSPQSSGMNWFAMVAFNLSSASISKYGKQQIFSSTTTTAGVGGRELWLEHSFLKDTNALQMNDCTFKFRSNSFGPFLCHTLNSFLGFQMCKIFAQVFIVLRGFNKLPNIGVYSKSVL